MPTYIGFNTIKNNTLQTNELRVGLEGGLGGITRPVVSSKKYRLTDEQLVIRDFVNALSIPQGQKVGKPEYGTLLWTFIFEPNTPDLHFKVQEEMQRVAQLDPRITLQNLKLYVQDTGILVEIEISIEPFNNYQVYNLFFNSQNNTVLQI